MPVDGDFPPPLPPEKAREFRVRRRGRNRALMLALAGICILFYAVAMVKLAAVGHVGAGAG